MTVRPFPVTRPAFSTEGFARWAADHSGRIDAALSVLVALAVFALYNATLTPSLSYISPDGNELSTTAYTLGLAHPTGYPLYTWLGKAFTFLPVGDVAHRVNLMSALLAAGGCGLLFAILRELRCWRTIAAFGALFMASSTTLWSQATISEVYAPNFFFVALGIYLLLRWGREQRDADVARHGSLRSTLLFSGWALTASAAAGMHMSSLGLLGGYGIYILLVNWRVICQPLVLLPGLLMFALGLMQFLWLPIRTVMGEPSPDPINPATWDGFLRYTINAFPQFKWQFPLELLPDRFMLYGTFVRGNFGWFGIALAFAGAAAMAILRPRTFVMLALMWSAHLVFFMEYQAMDIDVFFIPAHFILAIAIACGAQQIVTQSARAVRTVPFAPMAVSGLILAMLALPLQDQLRDNYVTHDQSDHTEINDFYRNVYRVLPENSILLGGTGVFAFDMFYYQYVYDLRPDVTLPGSGLPIGTIANRPNDGRAMFTVEGNFGPSFGRSLAGGEWNIPVLVTPAHDVDTAFRSRDLVLYRVSNTPPAVIANNTRPSVTLNHEVAPGLTLAGVEVSESTAEAGGAIHVKLFWMLERASNTRVTMAVGEDAAASHTHLAGFGLFERYDQQVAPISGKLLVEEFDFVVLSSTSRGSHPLTIQGNGTPITIATIEVH